MCRCESHSHVHTAHRVSEPDTHMHTTHWHLVSHLDTHASYTLQTHIHPTHWHTCILHVDTWHTHIIHIDTQTYMLHSDTESRTLSLERRRAVWHFSDFFRRNGAYIYINSYVWHIHAYDAYIQKYTHLDLLRKEVGHVVFLISHRSNVALLVFSRGLLFHL